jgi:hypothetical protein
LSGPWTVATDNEVEHLVSSLDSLLDGELALAMLVACGGRAIPYLQTYLLAGSPRTISLPRCRAARALGDLGAHATLISYFREYTPPQDPEVLFSEDAVRSTVARELLRWKSDEVFDVLLRAAMQRATSGLILALAEFQRAEAIPVLFAVLEDDFCRDTAKDALRMVLREACHYAVLTIRGLTETSIMGPASLRRRRATLQLMSESGISSDEWWDLRNFIADEDADVVIAVAKIGSRIATDEDQANLLRALFRVSSRLNWLQEDEVLKLLDAHPELARQAAEASLTEAKMRGQSPDWLSSSWRVLRHVLGREQKKECF